MQGSKPGQPQVRGRCSPTRLIPACSSMSQHKIELQNNITTSNIPISISIDSCYSKTVKCLGNLHPPTPQDDSVKAFNKPGCWYTFTQLNGFNDRVMIGRLYFGVCLCLLSAMEEETWDNALQKFSLPMSTQNEGKRTRMERLLGSATGWVG